MANKQKVECFAPVEDKFQPFDYEWLSGTVISGKYELPFAKFLAISRVHQLDLSLARASIMAVKKNQDENFLRNVRIPFPKIPTNATYIRTHLQRYEVNLRQDFMRLDKIMNKNKAYNKAVIYVERLEQFNEITGLIRVRKRQMIDQLYGCQPKDVKSKLRVIGILATLDAIMLIMQKVYGLYVDQEKGIYGECIPDIVLKVLIDLYKITTEERCASDILNQEIGRKLEILRAKAQEAAMIFYTRKEAFCHKYYTGEEPDGHAPTQRFTMSLKSSDFPSAISDRAVSMMWMLQRQRRELIRLNEQLFFAKAAPNVWPKEGGVGVFRINCCDGPPAFFSNMWKHVETSKINEIIATSKNAYVKCRPEKVVGNEMLLDIQALLHIYCTVPTCDEIYIAFQKEFKAEIQSQRIQRNTAKDLATKFTEVVVEEIDTTDARRKYRVPKATAPLALRIARKLARSYMAYVCTYSKNPPRRFRSRSPSPIPEDNCPLHLIGYPDGRGPNDHPSSSETESDYATDEGPDHRESQDTEDSDEDSDDSDRNGAIFDAARHAARVAFLLTALASDSNVVFVDENNQMVQVPDELIDHFLSNVSGVILEPDMSAPYLNVPVD